MVTEIQRDTRYHVQTMKARLQEMITHLRVDIQEVDEPHRHREERSDAAIQSHRRSLTIPWIAWLRSL
jgi:hypothetical protein